MEPSLLNDDGQFVGDLEVSLDVFMLVSVWILAGEKHESDGFVIGDQGAGEAGSTLNSDVQRRIVANH